MEMLNHKFNEFAKQLASSAPTPGGGGASAAVGALSASLVSMVANLTVGKKKYAQYEEDMHRILSETEELQQELMELCDEDARVFQPLSKAYSLPKDTKEQQQYKAEVMEKALYDASIAPLKIMKTVSRVADLVDEVSVKGSRMAISDAGVAATFAQAAARGASMNVWINVRSMKNRETAEDLKQQAVDILNHVDEITDRTYLRIKDSLF